jgi:hypothetical protein
VLVWKIGLAAAEGGEGIQTGMGWAQRRRRVARRRTLAASRAYERGEVGMIT